MTAPARWELVSVAGREPRPLPRALLEAPPVIFLWPDHARPAPGTPHPSPFLAGKGWEMDVSGVWIRKIGAGNDH